MVAVMIIIAVALKKANQPYIIGYILAGVLMGESGLGYIQSSEMIEVVGEIGLILLLFFVGMEISLPDYKKQWKVASVGTMLQICFTVAVIGGLGYFLGWSLNRSIVIGLVVALSSSAVVIKLLQDKRLMEHQLGKNLVSILLTQDILLAPILVLISVLGGSSQSFSDIGLLITGAILCVLVLAFIYFKKELRIPYSKVLENDNELQVFAAIAFCFGGAMATSVFGLSPALGAFIGGMFIHAANASHWIEDTLNSFRIIFVSVFFVGVGLQIDLAFIEAHLASIMLVLFGVFVVNHLLNAVVLRLVGSKWKEAILGGAYLAQIGELSFLLCLAALQFNIITEFSYSFTISLIAITLIISPFWISLTERLTGKIETSES